MSKQLLLNLNGSNKGALYKWLNNFQGEPRIAWYPSAGEDFRDLLYLHPKFSEQMPAKIADPACPDLFLHSDYFPHQESKFLDNRSIHLDDRTSFYVRSIEELPRCDLPLDDNIVSFPKGSDATGRVLFLEVEVLSVLGAFTAPVIYAFVENSAFCAQRILPSNGKFSHIINVRYGGGCGGGGKSSGIWLLNVLRRLECECFVTAGNYSKESGDEQTYALYPALSGAEDTTQLNPIRVLPSESWSGHGDVSWNIVNPKEEASDLKTGI